MDRSSPSKKSTAQTVVCPRCECGTLSNRSVLGVEFPGSCQQNDCTRGPYVADINIFAPFMDMKETENLHATEGHERLDPDGSGVETVDRSTIDKPWRWKNETNERGDRSKKRYRETGTAHAVHGSED